MKLGEATDLVFATEASLPERTSCRTGLSLSCSKLLLGRVLQCTHVQENGEVFPVKDNKIECGSSRYYWSTGGAYSEIVSETRQRHQFDNRIRELSAKTVFQNDEVD